MFAVILCHADVVELFGQPRLRYLLLRGSLAQTNANETLHARYKASSACLEGCREMHPLCKFIIYLPFPAKIITVNSTLLILKPFVS
jgi:hypothetical protein